MSGRDLGLALANGMIAFVKDLNFPTTFKEAARRLLVRRSTQ